MESTSTLCITSQWLEAIEAIEAIHKCATLSSSYRFPVSPILPTRTLPTNEP